MKLIENKVYLTLAECLECGMTEDTIKKAKVRGSNSWRIIDDPDDNRKILISFDDLTGDRKYKVERRFGNVYVLVARQPILDMVNRVMNYRANEWFMQYRYSSVVGEAQKALPIDAVNKYTRGDKWLNMLADLDAKAAKKELGLTMNEFYMHCCDLIGMERERGKLEDYKGLEVLAGDFPTSYRRLIPRVNEYRTLRKTGETDAWASLVDPRFGNKNAAKLGKVDPYICDSDGENGENVALIDGENDLKSGNKGGAFALERWKDQMAVIRAIARMYLNFNAEQVAKMANLVFERNGMKTVSGATIYNIINENQELLAAGRRGKKVYMNEMAMQVTRSGPTHPMQYWTLDGWTVELLYKVKGKKGWEYKRLVVVVVLDAFNKYPIGYAVGDRETAELIREANRNALKHVFDLTGTSYRPWQLQSDNYQIKHLTPFYQAMAQLHTPAAVGNSKAKIIEPYFKDLNKNYCQYLPNWSGFNVTASKKNQVNVEMLDKIKHMFPEREGVEEQIHVIMQRERQEKQEEWLASFETMKQGENTRLMPKEIDDMSYLLAMGRPLGKTNVIAGVGIEKQISGQKYLFDSFDAEFRQMRHIDWQLVGDELDLSKVLAVSPDGKYKYVLEQKHVVPMAIRDQNEEDRKHLSRVRGYNKGRIEDITELAAEDNELAMAVIANTPLALDSHQELALKTMFTHRGQQKEAIQDAKRLESGKRSEERREAREEQAAADDWDMKRLEYLRQQMS